MIAARTGQALAGRRLEPMGLSVRLCGVLNLLAEGPVSQQAIGERLGIDRTTMVEIIDELESQEVVVRRRNPSDRRSYALNLTSKGKAVQKRAARAFDTAADEFFGALSKRERDSLADMLRRLIQSADGHIAESSR